MINVTQTFLPELEEYTSLLKKIWKSKWLTNRGELILELENKLKKYLNIDNIIITNNGTLPLQIALKILGGNGEIITTPFSYVATCAAIVWENCTPVFVDIDPNHLTIDETKIEQAITNRTTCILATHVFGNACNIEKIEAIANKHNIKVIYDAAHCFAVNYHNKSIFSFGDVSTCSFHATKIFHTGEGGAMFANDEKIKEKLMYSHNFGHNGPYEFFGLGINAKVSELSGAMGLAVLPYMEEILNSREEIVKYYDSNLNWTSLKKMKLRENLKWNYSYYPVIFSNEKVLLKIQTILNEHEIYPRRYFYPSLNTIEYTGGQQMPVSEAISKCILCLPLYVGLTKENCKNIVTYINQNI